MKSSKIEDEYKIPVESAEDIFHISRAFEYSLALHIANNIDIFTELSAKPMTVQELSENTGVDSAVLKKIIIVCTAMGLLLTDGNTFSNSLIACRYFVKGEPDYIGDAIWLTGTWWDRLDDFRKTIINQYQQFKGVPEEFVFHNRFISAMNDFAVNSAAQMLADAVDLSGKHKLLDVGGGPGTYSIFFCRKYPELTATIFDLPETEPVFNKTVKSFGMTDRIDFVQGDMDKDPLGSGYDAVLVSNVMHGYRGESIPSKAFEALNPDGIIMIRDFILKPDLSGPLSAALFNMRMGAYTEDEIIDFLKDAGFIKYDCRELGDSSLIIARKPG